MDFKNETELQNFVNDIPYYSGKDSYCLGDSLEEAAEIIRLIVESTPNPEEGSTVCGNG